MKPTQLKSGAWRVRVFIGRDASGKQKFISVTRNNKMECLRDAADLALHYRERTRDPRSMTLSEAIDDYLAVKSNILSPSTIRGYDAIKRHSLQGLMNMKLDTITTHVAQKAINYEAATKAPKTIANIYGLLSTILNYYCDRQLKVALPPKQPKHHNILTEEEISVFIKAVENHPCEIPILLALMLGLRRGEILGIQEQDYDRKNKRIRIHRVMVQTKDSTFVEKETPKNLTSNRTLSVPKYLADKLEAAFDKYHTIPMYTPAKITKAVHNICKANGLPDMTLHDLRRQNASVMLNLGIADKYAMERGGWATPNIMKSVYQMTMADQRVNVDNLINGYFEQLAGSVAPSVDTASQKS